MPIPEQQLDTWSNQGAITSSKNTYEAIKDAINKSSALDGKSFEIYLQGSYKNSTNIRGDSDVDIVVQLNSTFYKDLTNLSQRERELYESEHSAATYHWSHFKSDLISVLEDYFGKSSVKVGNKSIKIGPASGRLPADVVPCTQYRRYRKYNGVNNSEFVEGMCFWTTKENRFVVNYPKVHYDNGVGKNQNTLGKYKPFIRVIKNARTYMDNKGLFDKSLAPGYFIEGLLYNVPNNKYKSSFEESFYEILKWIGESDIETFLCQNEQSPLFGNTPEQWDPFKASQFYTALLNLWNNWGK